MKQLNFFDAPIKQAKARATDPNASHAAAEEVTKSGALNGQCRRIAEALAEVAANQLMAHKTPGELANFINKQSQSNFYDSVRVSKRMSNLRDAGLAATFGERKCESQKRLCQVWVFADCCCGNHENHGAARLPDTDFVTLQCTKCGRGLGVRRVAS